uniref:Uncharacterized protein n=1 Tax=Siphoviridae sp. ctv4j104 TaxID=2826510 RepID=A0A8S5MAB4_9CAUD|nr:MAG TPA: hypothetical protein [Siphoviridae sp. ctv4j104]
MLYKGEQEKTLNDCIRATAERAKKLDGSAPFDCSGLKCDKCPFDEYCRESSNFYTVQEWIELLQEKGVTVDPALVAEYCKVNIEPTALTDAINYLTQQRKYIEETIEDEILRGNSIKYLNKASVAIHNALKYLSTADSMLRKQRGE